MFNPSVGWQNICSGLSGQNTIVCHLLCQEFVKLTASSTFFIAKNFDDDNVAWNLLIYHCEEAMQREPEAKRTLAFLANLSLDIRTTGYEHQNKFQEFVQRLEELGSVSSESTYLCWYIDHIDTPDYDYAVESLKATLGADLETCYMRVSYKALDVAKSKPTDQNTLMPR